MVEQVTKSCMGRRRSRVQASLCALLLLLFCAASPPPDLPPPDSVAVLRRGISITNWFRFPPARDDASLHRYMPDAALAGLRRVGFTFIRLPVQPDLFGVLGGGFDPDRLKLLRDEIRRVQARGFGVVVDAQPDGWDVDGSPADRSRLISFWQALAPLLSELDPRLTFPEPLNEPVFRDPAAWNAFQRVLVRTLRAALPTSTLVLTGADWGSVDGLLRLEPVDDVNVVYSFHFYEPTVLTTLAAFELGLDRAALARLPFPAEPANCAAAAAKTAHRRTRDVMEYYCLEQWDPAHLAVRIANASRWARDRHTIVIMGEFGASASLAAPTRLAWLGSVRATAEQFGMGWALWGYEDSMGFGADPGATQPLDAATLQALGLRVMP